MKYILLTLLLLSGTVFAMSDIKAHFFINGKSENFMVKPNTPTSIEVYFTDNKTNEVIKDFKVMHGKLMHMVLIRKDLSVFKHFHPYFDPVTGLFQMTLNLPLHDPDNFDNQLSKGGHYMLMADVEVKGKGMRMSHVMLHVMGDHSREELILDQEINGKIIKEIVTKDGTIRATMTRSLTYGCQNVLVDMDVFMEEFINGKWQPMQDLDDWLSMGAHAVWVSQKFMGKPMAYAHMHATIPRVIVDEDGNVEDQGPWDSYLYFNYNDQLHMKKGPQKMWMQIKYKGTVYKIPFIFSYNRDESNLSC
jgi:hypothetical protein